MHDKTQIWYPEQVQAQISKGIAPKPVFVDLKISILKPIYAQWVIQYYDHISTNKDIVKNGWHRSRITKVIEGNICKEDEYEN